MMPLDDAYANGAYIAGAETYPPKWATAASEFRNRHKATAELRVPYGATDRQVFDFFNTEGAAHGTLVFVHGGYWKAFDHQSWSHLAAGALAKGWCVAMPGYDLCPDVRISEITRQIAAAVTEISARTEGPIALTGHSAGGHLVARMTDPLVLPACVLQRIKQIAPISPVADLEPLLQTSMNEILRLDTKEARNESPVHMGRPEGAKVTVWVGANERPVFVDQATTLAAAWEAEQVIAPGRHHFDIIDDLENPTSEIVAFLTG